MALLLGRRSLAGGLPDLWLTCEHFVGKVSAMGQPTRPTQPSIQMSSNPCNYMDYEGGDH